MKARIGLLGKVRLFVLKEKMCSAKKWQILSLFYGQADTEPSTHVAYNLHDSYDWPLLGQRLLLLLNRNWGNLAFHLNGIDK